MRFIKIVLLIVFSVLRINAQEYKSGKVSNRELQEKSCPNDSNAVAAILYNKAKTHFVYDLKNGFTVIHEYEFRIKIYKKEGLNWANYRVPYYVGYENLDDDRLKFSDAFTYNLENGVVVKTKLKSEGNLKKNVNKYWEEASLVMPNVKVGSVIEFKYSIESQNLVKFPVFNFQQDIPVNYAEYVTEIPLAYIYKPILTGLLKVKSDAKIETGHGNYIDVTSRTSYINFQQIKSTYIAENVPALKEENYVDNIQNYRSSVLHELEKTQFSESEKSKKNYTLTWGGVAKTIFEDKYFGKELRERLYFENDLKAILTNYTAKIDRLNAIFKFVQQKMNWNGIYGYSSDKGVRKAYEEGTGNIAEINFILIAMLNYSGINTDPVLISTKEHGVPVFPNRTVFNCVIAAADIDGKRNLLDATNKYTTLNILPFSDLNWTGRLIRQDGTSEEINLVPIAQSNTISNIMISIDNDGKIYGKARVNKSDYEALKFREKNTGVDKENYIEKLENDLDKIQISDYAIDNGIDLSKPVIETFTFESHNHSEIIGDKMFIKPLLFFTKTNNPFLPEKRELPVYFGYPKQEKYNVTIEIPDGYTVESLPQAVNVTAEGVSAFKYMIVYSGNKIQVSIMSEINLAIVASDFYQELKDFYQKMIDKQNEKIVLKKI